MKVTIIHIKNRLPLFLLLLFVNIPQAMGVDDHPDDVAGIRENDRIIVNGPSVRGSFEVEDDLDFFSFSAFSGDSYEIVTGSLVPVEEIDTYLALYDTDGMTVITVDDDSGPGFLSRIDWKCDVSETYYIMVRHSEFRPESGEYSLTIKGYGLAGAIAIMKVLSGLTPPSTLTLSGDVNHDQKTGLEEVIFFLQRLSGFR